MMSQTENTRICPTEDGIDQVSEEPCPFDRLPPEVLQIIHRKLDLPDLFRASRVCRRWQDCFPKELLSEFAGMLIIFKQELDWKPAKQTGITLNLDSIIRYLEDALASSTFPKLTNLKSLNRCGLTDSAFLTMSSWLKDINVVTLEHESDISDAGLRHVANWNLTCLWLSGCAKVTDDFLAVLMESSRIQTNLRELMIGGSPAMTDEGLSHVANIKGLTQLTLSDTFGDAAIHNLVKGKSQIVCLIIIFCSAMSNDVMRHVACIDSLRVLKLRNMSQITSQGLYHLHNYGSRVESIFFVLCNMLEASQAFPLRTLVSLQMLAFDYTPVARGFMRNLVAGSSNIHTITMNRNIFINDDMRHLARMESLRKLTVQGCTTLTAQGYLALARGGSQIQRLKAHPPDEAALHLANLVHLKVLNLSHSQIGERFLDDLTKWWPEIATLKLSGCQNVDDTGLLHVSRLPVLSKLVLAHCMVSEMGFSNALDGLLGLENLDVSGCQLLGGQTLTIIANALFLLGTLKMDGRHVTDEGMSVAACKLQKLAIFVVDGVCRMNDIQRLRGPDL